MSTPLQHPEIYKFNHQVITLSWNAVDYEKITSFLHSVTNSVRHKLSSALTDIVPCYNSITIYFKHSYTDDDISILKQIIQESVVEQNFLVSRLKIPVCFDDRYALDLDYMSKFLNIPADDIVDEFCSRTYSVAFLGFLPGFPYLNGLSHKLAIPRKPSPRSSILPGTVGIAGKQAGIYPQHSPGGWNIIGICPLILFNPVQPPYALFQPGDEVEFFQIDQSAFEKLVSEHTDLSNLRKILIQGV